MTPDCEHATATFPRVQMGATAPSSFIQGVPYLSWAATASSPILASGEARTHEVARSLPYSLCKCKSVREVALKPSPGCWGSMESKSSVTLPGSPPGIAEGEEQHSYRYPALRIFPQAQAGSWVVQPIARGCTELRAFG